MKTWHLKTTNDFSKLSLGDVVYLSGPLMTARDKAHRKMFELLSTKKKLPFSVLPVLFHAGPIVKQQNKKFSLVAIGSTTSARLSAYSSLVAGLGARAIIGKGGMDLEAGLGRAHGKGVAAGGMARGKERGLAYLSYTGGCAAIAAEHLRIKKVFWAEELGTAEAVWFLEAKEFGPLIVAQKGKKTLYK